MRIAILTTQCPFVVGGAELHARGLERALRAHGHEAEIVSMPFKWYPANTVLDHMVAARSLDVSEFSGVPINLAICLKFPAYLMQHPNKTFWILHQHRQSYDLWDSGQSDLFVSEGGQVAREAIRAADNAEFSRARRIFSNSDNVAKRLKRYNGVVATPLYHPPPLAGRLTVGEFGDYFYYPSRLSETKRQNFVLHSLALAQRNVRVVFSGVPDDRNHGVELKKLAQALGVADRVQWRGFVSDEEMIELYAGARGVLFTPVDEDLGYIALEAMLVGKPLLTLSDAGEPATLVRHQVEGLVVAPEHAAFADAMNRVADSTALARRMGEAGRERYRSMDISWANVVAKLTGIAPKSADLSTPIVAISPASQSTQEPADAQRPSERALAMTLDASRNLTLRELDDQFELGEGFTGHRAYYETHWPRYCATLDVLTRSDIKARRVLELGSSRPYVFSALLKARFPEASLSVVQENPAGLHWHEKIVARKGRAEDIDLNVFGLNIETSRLPFKSGEVDLVVAMEVLEHLAIDPSFVFREAQRVLREGGVFLVTTPNLVSLAGAARALEAKSPYSFGVFVPWNGAYGRHNREYTPQEVEELGRYAGLETLSLMTADLFRSGEVSRDLVDYMDLHGHSLDLRGQTIFYLGRKTSSTSSFGYPQSLYTAEPSIFSSEIELRSADEGKGCFIIRVANVSPLSWPAQGPDRVRLTVDRVDQNGLVTRDAQSFDLPRDVPPGENLEISLRAVSEPSLGDCWHEIGLYAEGRGPFKGTGRSKIVSIFATELRPLRRNCDSA
jgi:glycosyltransferase involved in cell wall biosynthesis/SAM-dependent methyltransferase